MWVSQLWPVWSAINCVGIISMKYLRKGRKVGIWMGKMEWGIVTSKIPRKNVVHKPELVFRGVSFRWISARKAFKDLLYSEKALHVICFPSFVDVLLKLRAPIAMNTWCRPGEFWNCDFIVFTSREATAKLFFMMKFVKKYLMKRVVWSSGIFDDILGSRLWMMIDDWVGTGPRFMKTTLLLFDDWEVQTKLFLLQ